MVWLNKMSEKNQKESFLKKGGKWGAILGAAWIVLNIAIPLAVLRIPAVQTYLAAIKDKLPFEIPGIS